jgi:hypothetical protein
VLTFASLGEGRKSGQKGLDFLVPVQRVQSKEYREPTSGLEPLTCSLRVSLFPTPNSAKNGCFAGTCDSDLSVKYQQISPNVAKYRLYC